jgi:hypothetical protein
VCAVEGGHRTELLVRLSVEDVVSLELVAKVMVQIAPLCLTRADTSLLDLNPLVVMSNPLIATISMPVDTFPVASAFPFGAVPLGVRCNYGGNNEERRPERHAVRGWATNPATSTMNSATTLMASRSTVNHNSSAELHNLVQKQGSPCGCFHNRKTP